LFEICTISMNCELYTLQIIIYNLHVELNFNVALIKQAVVERRRSECSTHSNALDDVKVLNTTNPPSLTSFTIFVSRVDIFNLFLNTVYLHDYISLNY
jgi:hypothetical protein